RPAGPAPTASTSYSMTSRSLIGCICLKILQEGPNCPGLPGGRQIVRLRAMLEAIHLAGADLLFDPRWLPGPAADKLFKNLRDPVQAGIEWEVHRLKIFGREVESPRPSRWFGDP